MEMPPHSPSRRGVSSNVVRTTLQSRNKKRADAKIYPFVVEKFPY